MRKLSVVCLCLAALTAASALCSADGFERLKGRESRAAARGGSLDSLSFTLGPVAAGAETLQTLSTVDWDFSRPNGAALTTSHVIARLFLSTNTGVGFTGDSLYMATETSSDGINWAVGAFVGAAVTTAGDKVIGLPISVDSDAGGANPWRAPAIRLLIRMDSGSSASAYITAATVVYPSITQANH